MRDHLATLIEDFRRYGGETAVVRHQGNRRRVTTYGEIARQAGRFAALLVRRGIGPGDRVLLWGENSAEWIAAFHGCLLRGVLAVPLDAHGTADFALRVAADVKPKLVVGDAELLEQLKSACLAEEQGLCFPTLGAKIRRGGRQGWCAQSGWADADRQADWRTGTQVLESPSEAVDDEGRLGDSLLCFEDWLEALPEEEAGPIAGLSAETPLQILFTSGTTGEPKGIVITHGNVMASVGPIETGSQPYLKYERLIHPLRILHTLPLSHVFGQMMGLWVPHLYRAEVHFESRLVAARLVETIKRERISVLAAVPRVLALLKTHLEAALPGLAERAEGPKGTAKGVPVWLRWWRFRDVHRVFGLKFWAFVCGGGALPPSLEKFWNAVGLVMVQGYGMTETTAIITLNHPFHVAEGTIGKPLPGREVKLGPDGEVLVRGASISSATWSGGTLHARSDEWLATGDLAQTDAAGDLRFLGRKSEVIVTAAGLNVHPEDLEAAIEQEPAVAACAVVGMETPAGMEPCAVLAMRGGGEQAATAIERANGRLAEFQRLRRWVLWPEPDLPRTSTGKVRRKAVAEWLAKVQAAGHNGNGKGARAFGASEDWLLAMIAQITGENPPGVGDELHLSEDLHLDSLGKVQLAAAIEERLGIATENGLWEHVQTLGDLRRLISSGPESAPAKGTAGLNGAGGARVDVRAQAAGAQKQASVGAESQAEARPAAKYVYPHWPWWWVFRAVRAAFVEVAMRPLVWALANPKVVRAGTDRLDAREPMLIVANHVTSFDGPFLEYALPGRVRRRMAVAMSGEMLDDYRHFRNPERTTVEAGFYAVGPAIHALLTSLFNVFPLPKQRDFQRSFAHAGEALDRGFNVMLFPEGTRSAEGTLARFRPGIGLLVKQSGVPVLPMAIRGLGELKTRQRGWFRPGTIEVRVGEPMRFASMDSEGDITARLQAEVEKLLEEPGARSMVP